MGSSEDQGRRKSRWYLVWIVRCEHNKLDPRADESYGRPRRTVPPRRSLVAATHTENSKNITYFWISSLSLSTLRSVCNVRRHSLSIYKVYKQTNRTYLNTYNELTLTMVSINVRLTKSKQCLVVLCIRICLK